MEESEKRTEHFSSVKADLAVEQPKHAQSKQSSRNISTTTVSVRSISGEAKELQNLIRFSVMHGRSPCTIVTTGGLVCCVSTQQAV